MKPGRSSAKWRVDANGVAGALALLPRFVAERTVAVEVREVDILLRLARPPWANG